MLVNANANLLFWSNKTASELEKETTAHLVAGSKPSHHENRFSVKPPCWSVENCVDFISSVI